MAARSACWPEAAGDSKNYHLGAYTGSQWAATGGAVALRLSAAYSFHQINTARTVAFEGFTDRLSADYSAGTAQVFGELGRSFFVGSSGSIEPFIDAAYVNVHSGSFTEQGGAAALSAHGENTDGVFSTVGLHWATRFGTSDARLSATGTVG
jgi:outer membrane autotransporter protein